MLTATTNNWSHCTMLCVKKGRIIGKDMTSWFSFTTTHHRTRQQWSKTTWRHSTGKLNTSSRLLTRPGIFWLSCFVDGPRASATSILTSEDVRKWLDECLPQKMRNFFGLVYTNCPKDGKMYSFCFLGKKKCVFLTKNNGFNTSGIYIYIYIYVGRLISLVNFHEMAL